MEDEDRRRNRLLDLVDVEDLEALHRLRYKKWLYSDRIEDRHSQLKVFFIYI